MPDFLEKMRQAAKDYKVYVANKPNDGVIEPEVIIEESKGEIIVNETIDQPQQDMLSELEVVETPNVINEEKSDSGVYGLRDKDDRATIDDELSEQRAEKQNGYLRYFFLTKLFAWQLYTFSSANFSIDDENNSDVGHTGETDRLEPPSGGQ